MIYIVSVSGGKDSAAAAIWYCKNVPKDADKTYFVFSDTGIEPSSVYSFLDELDAKILGPNGFKLARVSREHPGYLTPWDSLYDRKGKVTRGKNAGQDAKPCMPGPVMRSCTERLKIRPLRAWRKATIDKNTPVTWVIGFRADEGSAERRRVATKSLMGNGDALWRPFMEIGYGIKEVHALIKDAGLELPGFYKWTGRSGCALCFYKPLADIERAAIHEPELFAKMVALEKKTIEVQGHRASPYMLIHKLTLPEIEFLSGLGENETDLDERGCDDELKSCIL